jgi:uncharacterized protein
MKRNLVIDTSVFLTYIRFNKLYRLINAIVDYRLAVYVNSNLLQEIERNINKKVEIPIDTKEIIDYILEYCILSEVVSIFNQSPDAKDNFLFDLAIQTNSEIIVTQEKALLTFKESPVVIHNLKWFKETYPVPL